MKIAMSDDGRIPSMDQAMRTGMEVILFVREVSNEK